MVLTTFNVSYRGEEEKNRLWLAIILLFQLIIFHNHFLLLSILYNKSRQTFNFEGNILQTSTTIIVMCVVVPYDCNQL